MNKIETLDISNAYVIIGFNYLHYHVAFAQGFNYSVYEYLSKANLTNLRALSMRNCDIDYSIVKILSEWRLPQLRKLDMSNNLINDTSLELLLIK
jgi:hypothetical protein